MAKRTSLPSEILVYQSDEIDGEKIYSVAFSVNDIPEEYDGEIVGNYVLNNAHTFSVRRELKQR